MQNITDNKTISDLKKRINLYKKLIDNRFNAEDITEVYFNDDKLLKIYFDYKFRDEYTLTEWTESIFNLFLTYSSNNCSDDLVKELMKQMDLRFEIIDL